ncbi:PREDICTED: 26S proteasome non-ATPase regulatory subunit 4 homolog [Tarenaya hassleriana]|uniref:26S proteasome non-ATPase regulatory subunit 4 homolog n=1 Tax=Tarenaya hassleriana TaxID=28532 RepID=UPI00053C6BE6|nr:PREDICTED: 26S proteasome non-ATPase regulatory subunit 4 homolog [Tarenaya hassleriana]
MVELSVLVYWLPFSFISTPIFTRDGFFAAAAAPVASISGFEFGVDPNLDHKLALALRVSIKGKKSRQEVAAKKAAEEAAKQEKGGEQSNSLDATMADFTSTLRKLTYWLVSSHTLVVALEEDKENPLLQQAFQMSMNESPYGDGVQDTDMSNAAVDITDLELVESHHFWQRSWTSSLQLSVQENLDSSDRSSDMGKLLADQSFVSLILASLLGVDPNDASIKDLLASM